jgi:hypothetical protein
MASKLWGIGFLISMICNLRSVSDNSPVIRHSLRLIKTIQDSIAAHRIRNPERACKPLNRFMVSNGCPVLVPQGFRV